MGNESSPVLRQLESLLEKLQDPEAIATAFMVLASEVSAGLFLVDKRGKVTELAGPWSTEVLGLKAMRKMPVSSIENVHWQSQSPKNFNSQNQLMSFRYCRIALHHPYQNASIIVILPDEEYTSSVDQYSGVVRQENFRDALTGIANRALFYDHLNKSLSQAKRNSGRFGLMLLDLDRLDSINEAYGSRTGDRYLQHIASQLSSVVRGSDTLARIGSDEFVVIVDNVEAPKDIESVAEKLLSAASVPMQSGTEDIILSASIGISLYPKDGETPDALLRHADTAMSKAKDEGKNQHKVYIKNMTAPVVNYLLLENDLLRAMERDELRLTFQPQVLLSSGAIAGLEVLVRWQHPQRGLLSPSHFMPLAEETGVVEAIGTWALRKSCELFSRWLSQGYDFGTISVNVSARQFRDPALIKLVEDTLQASGLPAERLELELTESSTMENVVHAHDMLSELSRKGIAIALDDFGTGHSSMSYLHRFPIDKLKIDKSFIDQLETSKGDAAITQSLIDLARNLGLKVIAEGAERKSQVDWLRDHGCAYVQGYYYAQPLQEEELFDFISDSKSVTREGNQFRISP